MWLGWRLHFCAHLNPISLIMNFPHLFVNFLHFFLLSMSLEVSFETSTLVIHFLSFKINFFNFIILECHKLFFPYTEISLLSFRVHYDTYQNVKVNPHHFPLTIWTQKSTLEWPIFGYFLWISSPSPSSFTLEWLT